MGSSPAGTTPSSQTLAETLAEHDRNLPGMPRDYQRMIRQIRELMPKGSFKPVLDEAVAAERSMLGDSPGRIDLSEFIGGGF